MIRFTRYIKITAVINVLAVLFAFSAPAHARWDELVKPGVRYAGPPLQENVQSKPSSVYKVKEGDTLSEIACRYSISTDKLAALNNLTDKNLIYVGQIIHLPVSVVVHEVSRGETLSCIASNYNVDANYVAHYNNLEDGSNLCVGNKICIPVEGYSLAKSLPVGKLPWPVDGWISSPFGMRNGRLHEGVDLGANTGTPVRAAREGRVTIAASRGTYGLTVIIDHGSGLTTLYAHCSSLLVREGEWVRAGEKIARVGSTGRSTGPHLHFEVRLEGISYDPLLCLRKGYA
ncbi:MAG: M23 family metallopeptidase [Clostridiales bacterium]|nr:M23 family metallopeptidase [Clostridiales bacterium]MCF8022535.1 M23 family metallopeptidase [Clostridiales bacterium]